MVWIEWQKNDTGKKDFVYEGSEYVVERIERYNGKEYYKLLGKPTLNRYVSSWFVQLSDIDERELVNELVDIDTGD